MARKGFEDQPYTGATLVARDFRVQRRERFMVDRKMNRDAREPAQSSRQVDITTRCELPHVGRRE